MDYTLTYVAARNITLNLPVDLVREAKVYATQLFSTKAMQEALFREGRARVAADRLLALADQGPTVSGIWTASMNQSS
jgi:hypothetical protein